MGLFLVWFQGIEEAIPSRPEAQTLSAAVNGSLLILVKFLMDKASTQSAFAEAVTLPGLFFFLKDLFVSSYPKLPANVFWEGFPCSCKVSLTIEGYLVIVLPTFKEVVKICWLRYIYVHIFESSLPDFLGELAIGEHVFQGLF